MTTPDDHLLSGLRIQGRLADAMLAGKGIVLTQGGEPTFVPEDTRAAEWNLEALGEEKLRLAWQLCRELQKSLMPGALILKSNGKHYPGEPIPRWKLTLLRRPGAGKLWRKSSLLTLGEPGGGRAITPRRFLSALSSRLGVQGGLRPVYEDIEAAMRHQQLLGGTPPMPRYSRIRKGFIQPRWTVMERRKWQSMHKAAGWVLPLAWSEGVWVTADWTPTDGEELLLLPGTSSIGLRLPLTRLSPETLTCALTAEICDGALSIFLPPLSTAKAFEELVSAIEQTAIELESPPLSLEGYPPPHAEGWESLSVIPDPGVIEVNLPPARDWEQLESTVTALYSAADKAGLKATRRLPSGEIVPTGGGGHLVLGGTSLEENPFLLKPSLIPSFLRFIQHHPSLSYLFSGRFVGPSSQAPRIDESFFEVPRELDRALRFLEELDSPVDPRTIDATLRNLLLDLHGNTHKAEVSIDKFYNPFMPNGRLGLVEFRAIEMSARPESFLAINALWRAMAACFAAVPYREKLVDWREKLHGQYLLPSFLEQDLGEVLGFVNSHGFSFESSWFAPHLDFRFPILVEEMFEGFSWHLRRAVEHWPLLGEQPTPSGGLVRCVDSSTERLELRINAEKSCPVFINGRLLPLVSHPGGGYFGGIRFRTMMLPTCLHPGTAPHVPLEITFLDPQSRESRSWHYHPFLFGQEPDAAGPRLTSLEKGAIRYTPAMLSPKLNGDSVTLDLMA